jgi:hypothetical protein
MMTVANRNISYILLVFILLMQSISLLGQNENIKSLLENLTEQSETEFDYSDLLDAYTYILENPININSTETKELVELFLIDELQYQNLRTYIDTNGQLLSKQELLLVDGFDIETYSTILPFIKAGSIEKSEKKDLSRILKYGRHQAFFRYQRLLQEAIGYKNRTDSIWELKPNSKYLGNADKYYFKYQYKYQDLLSIGLVAEKDAGELFLENISNPHLDSIIGDKYTKGFDFYTAHAFVQNQSIIKQAVLGDYHLQFGQGLNLWSDLAFGKSPSSINIRRYGRGIKPNTSTNENTFLRGGAFNLSLFNIDLIIFYSKKFQDATDYSLSEDQESSFIQSLNGTGYHRTVNELSKKNNLQLELYGGRISFSGKNFNLGLTSSRTNLNKSLVNSGAPYQYFNFSGRSNTLIGSDFLLYLNKYSFFGEFSMQLNGGWAALSGINAPIHSRLALAVVYRNYQSNYINLFGSAFGENTTNNNEEGFYTGLIFQFSPKIKINAYADIFKFQWLKYQINKPSIGQEYLTNIQYDLSRDVQMYVRFRYKQKEKNFFEEGFTQNRVENYQKYSIRYHIAYQVHPLFILKNRIEIQYYDARSSGRREGFLVYQDVQYKSKNERLNLYSRFAIFDIEDYDARIYAYENDLLYVFSIPAFNNRGIRVFFLLNYKISNRIQFWIKFANSWFENIDEIGSGLNLIEGKNKTEVKAQLRVKI